MLKKASVMKILKNRLKDVRSKKAHGHIGYLDGYYDGLISGFESALFILGDKETVKLFESLSKRQP